MNPGTSRSFPPYVRNESGQPSPEADRQADERTMPGEGVAEVCGAVAGLAAVDDGMAAADAEGPVLSAAERGAVGAAVSVTRDPTSPGVVATTVGAGTVGDTPTPIAAAGEATATGGRAGAIGEATGTGR